MLHNQIEDLNYTKNLFGKQDNFEYLLFQTSQYLLSEFT